MGAVGNVVSVYLCVCACLCMCVCISPDHSPVLFVVHSTLGISPELLLVKQSTVLTFLIMRQPFGCSKDPLLC